MLQFAIWIGFYAAYQVARGAADRSVAPHSRTGARSSSSSTSLGALIEPSLQHVVEGSSLLIQATSITYWLSQFAVLGLTLLWVYFRHHDRFYDFRNVLIVANLLGLVGYLLVPTAPPRMFPEWGFVDTLAQHSQVSHESVRRARQPVCGDAEPARDGRADRRDHDGDARARAGRRCSGSRGRRGSAFAVMSTGNHYWSDVVAGVALAVSPRRSSTGHGSCAVTVRAA